MERVSIDAFACSAHPVVVSDSTGRLVLCNRAAATLLGCPAERLVGKFCWEVIKFRTAEGEPFCSPRCPIRQAAESGRGVESHRVLLTPTDGSEIPVNLLSFQAHVPEGTRVPVLHVMLPVGRRPWGETVAEASRHLRCLTRREREVLQLMAAGLSTAGMATSLCISDVTVRNHVQAILRKLKVHGRLEAVLALVREQGRQPGPDPG